MNHMILLTRRLLKFAPVIFVTYLNYKIIYDYNFNTQYIKDIINPDSDVYAKYSYSNWTNSKYIDRLWKGDACNDLPSNKKFEVSVVIYYDYELDDMSLFTNYISDRSAHITVRSMTIISTRRLPKLQDFPYNVTTIEAYWKFPDLDFMQWLADTWSLSPKGYLHHNNFILFLSARSIEKTEIKLQDVLQSTLENGVGCVQRPLPRHSYYHDRKILRTFAHADVENPRYYINLGEWQDKLNITSLMDKEIVPVCYGGSFAIQSQAALQKSKLYFPFLKAMKKDIKKHEASELVEFLERTWASIFSYHLPKESIEIMRNYTTSVYKLTCCHTGSLIYLTSHMKFFMGDTLRKEEIDYSKLRLTLVVSHCDEDMSWIQEYMKHIQIENVVIYSKCNSTIEGYSPPGSTIVRLPNVGRCDHTYAHWMKQMEEEDATENHIVLFFKASRLIHQFGMSYRPLYDVIRIATQHGFACESKHSDKSLYHDTSVFKKYSIFSHRGRKVSSHYNNMGEWLNELNIELPTPFTPVCYGGNFVAKASQIYSQRNVFEKIETSLMRGDDIQEGHFAERCWAGLLSYPLTSEETNVLQSIPSKVKYPQSAGYLAHLIPDE